MRLARAAWSRCEEAAACLQCLPQSSPGAACRRFVCCLTMGLLMLLPLMLLLLMPLRRTVGREGEG